jgi:hypothetical protein
LAATLRSAAVHASGQVSPFENTETVVSIVTIIRPVSESFPTIAEQDVDRPVSAPPVSASPVYEAPTAPPQALPVYETATALPQAPRPRIRPIDQSIQPPAKPVGRKRTLSSAVLLGGGIFLCLVIVAVGAYFLYPAFLGEETMTPTIPVIAVGETPSTTPSPQNSATPTPGITATGTSLPTETATATATATAGPVVSNLFFCLEPCLPNGGNAVTVASAGITQIYVRWSYENFPVGANYVRRWTNNGEEWVRYQCLWPGPSANVDEVPLTEPAGLRSGVWEVSILLDDVVIAQEQLTVTGNWTFWTPAGVFNTCYGRR